MGRPGGPAVVGLGEARIGIGMPVYNGEKHLAQAIESHLAQSYGDFRLVIGDNHSTDGTEAICRDYARLDRRVHYVRHAANLGGPGNFRRVFQLTSGLYHKWSTADDWWAPSFLEKAVAILDQDPDTVLCHPQTVLVDEAGTETGRYDDFLHLQEDRPADRFIRLLDTIMLCQAHLGLIRRAPMARTSLIGGELASDIRFLAELSLYGKFFVIPEHLFFRRFHEDSSSWDRTSMVRQRAYYAPGKAARFRFHTWRRFGLLLAGTARAPIPGEDKWRIYQYLGRRMRWQRGVLLRELVSLGKPDSRGLFLR